MNNYNDKTLKIYLNNDNQDEILSNASSSEKYIIEINSNLQKTNSDNVIKIKDLENQIEELENDNETLEKKNEYLKGLLKNFHEMNKSYKKLHENSKHMYSLCKNRTNTYIEENKKKVRIIELFCSILFSFLYWKMYIASFTCYSFIVTGFLLYIESLISGYKYPNLCMHVKLEKETIDSIKKTTAAQDYIHEFIDSC